MSHNNHHHCDDCEALLSKHYPYDYCPRCWQNRFNAPPGKHRFDYFEAAANPARVPTIFSYLPYELCTGRAIAASEQSRKMSA